MFFSQIQERCCFPDRLELKQILGDTPPAVAAHYYKKMDPTAPVMKSVRIVIDEILKAKRGDGLSDGYLRHLGYDLNKFNETFKCNVGSITGTEIDTWLRDGRDRGLDSVRVESQCDAALVHFVSCGASQGKTHKLLYSNSNSKQSTVIQISGGITNTYGFNNSFTAETNSWKLFSTSHASQVRYAFFNFSIPGCSGGLALRDIRYACRFQPNVTIEHRPSFSVIDHPTFSR